MPRIGAEAPPGAPSGPYNSGVTTTTSAALDDLRGALRTALDDSEAWLRAAAEAPGTPPERAADHLDAADQIRRNLRGRASSSLITVALIGGFSSGKSFLAGGLQGRLEMRRTTGDDGVLAEKFTGLMPSSPVPVNVCPVRVVPVAEDFEPDATGTGHLRVEFVDAPGVWEDVGNSPAPAVLASYVMEGADLAGRRPGHRDRQVAGIEILLAGSRIPAMLYDLPGWNSPNEVHNDIVRRSMADADCFIYVSPATRSLTEDDLELIRELYAHHLSTGRGARKPVLWVLTGIDTATQLDYRDKPAYLASVERNNHELRANFTVGGRPDTGFIGQGFMPVSAAAEVRAEHLAAEGRATEARHQKALSRMDALRETLLELIARETGPRHVALIADAAYSMLLPRVGALAERLREERLPRERLEAEKATLQARADAVRAAVPKIRQELEEELVRHVNRTVSPFGKLAGHLHDGLDDLIRATDVLRRRKAHEVEVAKSQLLQEWLEAPGGPKEVWTAQARRFRKTALATMRARLSDEEATDGLGRYRVADLDVRLPKREPQQAPASDLLPRTAAVIAVTTPVAATAGWMAGVVTAGMAFPPAAAVSGTAAIVFWGVRRRRERLTSLDVARREWIRDLDAEAEEIRERYRAASALQGMALIDSLVDKLEEYQEELESSVARIRERIAEPEIQDRQQLIDLLAGLVERGERATGMLRGLLAP